MSNNSSGQKRSYEVDGTTPLIDNNNAVDRDTPCIHSEQSNTTTTSPPQPPRKKAKPNMKGLHKRKKSLNRHKKGNKKGSNYDYEGIRDDMSKPNANAQEIRAHIAPADQRERAQPKLTRKQMGVLIKKKDKTINALTQDKDKLIITVHRVKKRVKSLENERRNLADVLKEHKRASNNMMYDIQQQSKTAIAELEELVDEAKTKQEEAEAQLEQEQLNNKSELRNERTLAHELISKSKSKLDKVLFKFVIAPLSLKVNAEVSLQLYKSPTLEKL